MLEVVEPAEYFRTIISNPMGMEEKLRATGQLVTWNRVERIIGAELGIPQTEEEHVEYAMKRAKLFLAAVSGDIELEPLEAICGF